jgi:hypothetical protein
MTNIDEVMITLHQIDPLPSISDFTENINNIDQPFNIIVNMDAVSGFSIIYMLKPYIEILQSNNEMLKPNLKWILLVHADIMPFYGLIWMNLQSQYPDTLRNIIFSNNITSGHKCLKCISADYDNHILDYTNDPDICVKCTG